MNVRVSLLALLIFVNPVMAAQEVQSANVKNRIKTAVITIGSLVAGVFLAYISYRYFGTAGKVNESEKAEDKAANPEKKKSDSASLTGQKIELYDEVRSVLEEELRRTKATTKEMKALVKAALEEQNQTTSAN